MTSLMAASATTCSWAAPATTSSPVVPATTACQAAPTTTPSCSRPIFGSDVVLDFTPKTDTLSIQSHINGLDIVKPGDLAAYISGTGTTSTITLGSDTIRLTGISKSDLLAHLDQYVKIV